MLDSLRNRGFDGRRDREVRPRPEVPGHRQLAAPVQQLIRLRERASAGGPVFLVGHSLGGFLSLLRAARHPELARGVVLLDSPLLGGWRAHSVQVAKGTPLMQRVSPGQRLAASGASNWPAARGGARALRRQGLRSRAGTRACCATTSKPASRRSDGQRRARASTATSRPPSTTRCRTTCGRCCGAIRCSARWPSSAARSRSRCGRSACAATRARWPTGASHWIEGTHLLPDANGREEHGALPGCLTGIRHRSAARRGPHGADLARL